MGETNGSSTPLGDLNINPGQVRPGGAPARVYLNEKVVPHLLDGMKSVAREQYVSLTFLDVLFCH